MLRLILGRVAISLVALLVISVVIFWSVEILPGNTAQEILGRSATHHSVAILSARLGLGQPLPLRYLSWLGGVLHGDWGISLAAGRPVVGYVGGRLANTLVLAGLSLLLYLPVTLLLSVLGAVAHGGIADTVVSTIFLIGIALPEYVVGIALLFVFGVLIPIFPPLSLIGGGQSVGQLLSEVTLPVVALTFMMCAYAIRLMRESLIQALESDHAVMATLKGLPRWRVVLRHALPDALGPALNATALNIAYLIGGIVVIETVFNYPGLGSLLVSSVSYHDVPVVEAIAMIMSAVYIAANLLADVAAMVVNPRLRGG